MPTTNEARASHTALRARAMRTSPVVATIRSTVIRERRSRVSPNGTKSNMPSEVPTCVSMAMRPTFVTVRPKARAMSARSGWI